MEPGAMGERASGVSVVVVWGPVDQALAARIDALVQRWLIEADGAVAIDISGVDGVSGALIGALLRASRRLAWRNRRLDVICADAEQRSRLEIAGVGLDELVSVH